MSRSDGCLILPRSGKQIQVSNLNISIEFRRKYFSAAYLFLVTHLIIFLFFNSGFPSHLECSFLSGLTTARLNQSMVSAVTIEAQKMHE